MTDVDGYYIVSALSLTLGVLVLMFFIRPTAHKLHGKFFFVMVQTSRFKGELQHWILPLGVSNWIDPPVPISICIYILYIY